MMQDFTYKFLIKMLALVMSKYRPGHPNWEFWLWNLAIFMLIWFYVKSNLADFRGSKPVKSTILEALNFDFFGNFTLENVKNIQKFKIQSCSYGQIVSFLSFKMTNIDFTYNLSGRKILKFPHCAFPIRLPKSVIHSVES